MAVKKGGFSHFISPPFMDPQDPRFSGIARLYGHKALQQFQAARVLVVGIGGVGSWVVESLARSGVGCLILADLDDICVTNINRQIHALTTHVGQSKVEVMARRVAEISPDCNVIEHHGFYSEAQAEAFFAYKPDLIIDAIDSLKPKCHLLATCYRQKIPVLTCGGAGGRTDPTQIQVADLSQSYGDALLSQVRRQLRLVHKLPLGEGTKKKLKIPTVFSAQAPLYPTAEGCVCTQKDSSGSQGRMGCDAGFGSATSLTGVFGFTLAALALKHLAK